MSRHRRQQRRRAGRAFMRAMKRRELGCFAADGKPLTAAEVMRTVNDVPGYPYASSAVPIADALFGALGFRRVE